MPTQPPTSPVYWREIEAGDPRLSDRPRLRPRDRRRQRHRPLGGRATGAGCPPTRREDAYDAIEWAAAQEWCDGNVGMVGVSYYGAIQLAAAALQPPHLKAIMPLERARRLLPRGLPPRRDPAHASSTSSTWSTPGAGTCRTWSRARRRSELEPRSSSGSARTRTWRMYAGLHNTAANPERAPLFFDLLAQPARRPLLLGALGLPPLRPDQDPVLHGVGLVGLRRTCTCAAPSSTTRESTRRASSSSRAASRPTRRWTRPTTPRSCAGTTTG